MAPLVHPGQNAGPTCSADGSGDEGVLEVHAFLRQPVHLGGVEDGIDGPEHIPPLIVGDDEQDVRSFIRGYCET